jgi:hypothetical protein
MKKILYIIASLSLLFSTASALSFFDNTSTVYTKNENQALDTTDICATDPIRCGMNNPGQNVQGLYYNAPITTVYEAQDQTLAYVHNLLNWLLSLL